MGASRLPRLVLINEDFKLEEVVDGQILREENRSGRESC
jgi:hypothetical protein